MIRNPYTEQTLKLLAGKKKKTELFGHLPVHLRFHRNLEERKSPVCRFNTTCILSFVSRGGSLPVYPSFASPLFFVFFILFPLCPQFVCYYVKLRRCVFFYSVLPAAGGKRGSSASEEERKEGRGGRRRLGAKVRKKDLTHKLQDRKTTKS